MKHDAMRNSNALRIFNSVKNGNTSVEEIMEDTGLSHVTVKDIGKLLTENRIFKAYTQLNDKRGRPSYNFKISENPYSVYMEEDKYSYILIAINAYSQVIFRHDYIKRLKFTFGENLARAINTVVSRPDYLNCFNFFGNCDEASSTLFPDFITKINLKEFIVKSVAPKDKTVIVEFDDKCYLSLYGHMHKTEAKIKGIERVIKCDTLISYKKDIIEGIFDSLRGATLLKMEEIIKKLK